MLLPIYSILPDDVETAAPEMETAIPTVEEAGESMPPCNCTVTQGSFTSPMPFMSTSNSAVNFYSYGVPINVSANTGLEMSETMLIMMHEDVTTGNTSLIIILDEPNDGTGGSASIDVNCLPGSATIDLSDEPGEFSGSPPTFSGNFNWNGCCTDGAVVGGVGCGDAFTINPSVTSGINTFALVFGTPTGASYINFPSLECPITINCGGTVCCEQAFEFTGTTQNAGCDNSADGSIDLTTDCAATPTFLWSNGMVTEDLFALLPGTYNVTITDLNGCSQSASYLIEADNPNPEPTAYGPSEFCAGDVVELGVNEFYSSYLWSNGSVGSPIIVTTPGEYIVTVTNAAGCTGTASTILTENPVPVPDIVGPSTICLFYDTITLDAGPGFTTYLWSNGDGAQEIDVTEFGGYSVTVTNSFGCTGIDFTVIDPLSNPFPMITGPTSVCSGTPIFLDAGAGYDSYLWSNGAPVQTIATSTEGTYSVTVTNADGCIGIASQEVSEYPVDSILLFQTSCNPADTGLFVQNFTNQYGCDSIEILEVSFSESDSVFLFDQSCNPQDTGVFVQTFTNQFGCDSITIETVDFLLSDSLSFQEFSCSPLDTGTVVQSLTNQNGCDSIVTTTTFLLPVDTVYLFEKSCDTTNAGVTQEVFTNNFGCDSLVITTTEYILVDTTFLYDTACDPNLTGVFEESYIGSEGCDSLVITTVDLLLSDTTYLDANTCDINQAGQSEELLVNMDGCDSLVITNTGFIPPDTTLLFAESCNPTEVGIFEEVLANGFGCDSILITTVSLLPSDTTAIFQTSCDPNQSGTEEVLLTNQFGCDSLLVITTSYAEADSTQISNTTCDPALAGVFVEILVSMDGCDSVVTTTIALLASDTVQVFAESCDPANVGTSEELLINQAGCDSLVITTTSLLPSDTTYLQDITCDFGQAGLSNEVYPNQFGCDSLVVTNTLFAPPDTTLLFVETCNPSEAGIGEVVLQNIIGCDSVVITTTSLLPSDTTVLQAFSCDPGQVGTEEVVLTNMFGCDSLVITSTAQLPTDTTWIFYGTCLVADTGLIATVLSNQSGCDSLVFEQTNLLPSASCQLDALIQGDTIGCSETTGMLSLTFLDGTPPYAYTWTDQSGNTGSGSIGQTGIPLPVSGLPPGTYIFEISDPDGLTTILNATVFQPEPLQINLQVNSDFNGYEISCSGATDGSATTAVVSGGLPPFSFNWSNGSQTVQADNLGEGWHSVTVTGAEGCQAIDSILLAGPDSIQFALSVAQPDCFTDGLGAISIDQVQGGAEPYRYALNGNNWLDNPIFEHLSFGQYLVEVEDANGCISSSYVFIHPYTELTVSLGQDETVEYGDSLMLQVLSSVPFNFLDSVYWEGIDCPNCPNVMVAPIATSSYSITVVDSLGCQASDALQVVVKKDFRYYIPNSFSPDHNGINDSFTIYSGPQLVRILEFHIFDRWGEPVFTYFNLPPNDPSYGWDGTYRGKALNPGVFVYFAILEFVDGSTKLVEGDVMLMK